MMEDVLAHALLHEPVESRRARSSKKFHQLLCQAKFQEFKFFLFSFRFIVCMTKLS